MNCTAGLNTSTRDGSVPFHSVPTPSLAIICEKASLRGKQQDDLMYCRQHNFVQYSSTQAIKIMKNILCMWKSWSNWLQTTELFKIIHNYGIMTTPHASWLHYYLRWAFTFKHSTVQNQLLLIFFNYSSNLIISGLSNKITDDADLGGWFFSCMHSALTAVDLKCAVLKDLTEHWFGVYTSWDKWVCVSGSDQICPYSGSDGALRSWTLPPEASVVCSPPTWGSSGAHLQRLNEIKQEEMSGLYNAYRWSNNFQCCNNNKTLF